MVKPKRLVYSEELWLTTLRESVHGDATLLLSRPRPRFSWGHILETS